MFSGTRGEVRLVGSIVSEDECNDVHSCRVFIHTVWVKLERGK